MIPGLSRLTDAADFTGRLDLYDGMLRLSGGGMTLTTYVRADAQQLVVEVTGADPNATQTAQVTLWPGRSPSARARLSNLRVEKPLVPTNSQAVGPEHTASSPNASPATAASTASCPP